MKNLPLFSRSIFFSSKEKKYHLKIFVKVIFVFQYNITEPLNVPFTIKVKPPFPS